MPARLVRTLTIKDHRTKPISKNSQKLSPASTRTEDSADNDLPIQIMAQTTPSKMTLIPLLKQLRGRLNYGLDTLLTSLLLLKQLGELPLIQER